jgi:hypothetical protein
MSPATIPPSSDSETDLKTDIATRTTPVPSVKSNDLDDAYLLYKNAGDPTDINVQEAKRVLRKIDYRLVPVLFIIYLLQYLDKNGINYASVYGLQAGTHLKGDQYSWLGSIFYFG